MSIYTISGNFLIPGTRKPSVFKACAVANTPAQAAEAVLPFLERQLSAENPKIWNHMKSQGFRLTSDFVETNLNIVKYIR